MEPVNPTVLLIEDDEAVRKVLCRILSYSKFNVLEASDGKAGIDLAISANPDAVVCDYRMPGLNGIETLRRLRASPVTNGVPVILITGASGTEMEDLARRLQGVYLLRKPFLFSDLIKLIRARLSGQAALARN